MQVKLSDLDALIGCEPSEAYKLAAKLKFEVRAMGEGLPPTKLFFKTIYIRINDLELIESILVNESHIEYDSL